MPKIRVAVNPVRTRRAMPRAHIGALVAAFTEKLTIAVLGHPAGASKMTVMNFSRSLGLGVGVDPKDHIDGFAPVGAIGRRVEHAHIFLHMRAIVVRQLRAVRWRVKEFRLCHSAQFAPIAAIYRQRRALLILIP